MISVTRRTQSALAEFYHDVINGLAKEQKTIPSKYFYDERGSTLFDEITHTVEYYPTVTEELIMENAVVEMINLIGPRSLFVELGSGSSRKTRILLDTLNNPASYIPVDISAEHLEQTAASLRTAYPELQIIPVAGDYTEPLELPLDDIDYGRIVVYYPGSTIGNFEPKHAVDFLRRIRRLAGDTGALLIGVDLVKDRSVVEAAYNDRSGITEAFNLNLLERINRELNGDFDVSAFSHRAVFNKEKSRIEMHLVSQKKQVVTIDGKTFDFEADEFIYTESSYKYTLDRFDRLATEAGFVTARTWLDHRRYFSIHFLEAHKS